MKSLTLLKLLQRSLAATSKQNLPPLSRLALKSGISTKYRQPQQQDVGFTLIELLILLLIVGILSAIAAPGWLAFINNQRLRTAQSGVYGALQLAQSNAKRSKVAWQASFRTQNNLVQWAVHPVIIDNNAVVIPNMPVSTSPSSASSVWYSLEDKITIDPTITGSSIKNLRELVSGTYIAIFNRQGCLVDEPDKECTDTATVPGFSIPQRIMLRHTELGAARKCAVVTTLLGAMRTGDDEASCNLTPPP